jgi:hypothetical protein
MAMQECPRSDLVVKTFEALLANLKKYPLLGKHHDTEERLIAVFDVVLHGADAELDERQLEVLTMMRVPRALYKPVKQPRRPKAKRARVVEEADSPATVRSSEFTVAGGWVHAGANA